MLSVFLYRLFQYTGIVWDDECANPNKKKRFRAFFCLDYYFTSTPMLRAVPSIIFIAAFISAALRSGIFFSAISFT